eukprot:15445954-Alexandrium_andersonii.AAC.2
MHLAEVVPLGAIPQDVLQIRPLVPAIRTRSVRCHEGLVFFVSRPNPPRLKRPEEVGIFHWAARRGLLGKSPVDASAWAQGSPGRSAETNHMALPKRSECRKDHAPRVKGE